MHRHVRGAIALLAIASVGTGCSTDPAPPAETSTTTTALSQPVSASGSATLGGALEATGDYEVLYSVDVLSCESRVAAPTYVIPLPGRLGTVRIQWLAALPQLQGPGSYDLTDLATLQATLTHDGTDAKTVYTAGPDTTATLELDAEGGGSFTFAGLLDSAGVELHGTATWACGPSD